MGAAAGGVARAPELEAERREPGVVELDGIGGERLGLGAQAVDSRLSHELHTSLDRDERRNVRRPSEEAAQAMRRLRSSPMSNWYSCPNQPLIGLTCGQSESSRTYRKPGAPGPAFRYL